MFTILFLATAIGLGGTVDLPVQIPNVSFEPGLSEILVDWPEGSWTNPAPHQTWERIKSVTQTQFGQLICVEATLDDLCFNIDI